MSNALAPAQAQLVEAAAEYAGAARAANTLKAYRSDWGAFETWCKDQGFAPLPAMPSTVALYAAHLAQDGRKVSTLARALVSISQAHKAAGAPSPTSDESVKTVVQGIRKTLGVAQEKKAPMRRADLVAALAAETSPRDRALLLFGFAGGFRRSELAALDVADLERVSAGYVVTLRRSKTNQDGRLERKFIALGLAELCPVRALEAWLAGRTAGPVFGVCTKTIARILKRAAKRAGKDPDRYSGHSLRRGLITEAHLAGVNDADTMRHVGIKSEEVFRGYIEESELVARAVRVL